MSARLKWITPKRRPQNDIVLADEGAGGLWWAEIDVTLTVRGAAALTRGRACPIAAEDLPAGVRGTVTRTGVLSAKVYVEGADPDDVMDVLVDLDLEAAQRLHAHARAGGMA
jgi:hypothetical protein